MEAVVKSRVSDVCAAALKAERDALNAKFVAQRVAGHEIDSVAFADHIADVLDPLLNAINEILPERVRHTLTDLYSSSLELFAASLLGPSSKVKEIDDVWRRLLPSIPRLVARDPARVVACLCNATYNISHQAGAGAPEWVDRMINVAPYCTDTTQLLECGRVLAWQAGMVQYRAAALLTAREMDTSLANRCLQLPIEFSSDDLCKVLDRLAADPWLRIAHPGKDAGERTSIQIVCTVGAFRGFGGLFLRPPVVSRTEGGFRVSDGYADWDLLVDAYGQLLTRTARRANATSAGGEAPTINSAGLVHWQTESAEFPQLGDASSSAFDGATLAVTLPTSYHVYLLARR